MRVSATRIALGISLLATLSIATSCGSDDPTTPGGDTTAPTVVSTVPANGATDVATNSVVTVVFSEAMEKNSADSTSVTMAPAVITSLQWSGDHTLTILHDEWPGDSNVTVTLGTGLSDLAGNHLAAAYTFSFTVSIPDTTAPTVISRTPADGATGVPQDEDIVLVFDEAMQATLDSQAVSLSTGTITAMNWTDDHTFVASHSVWPEETTVQVTMHPSFLDLAGNAVEASTWSFTTATDTIPPEVISLSPGIAETNVGVDQDVTIGFSEPMDQSSMTGNILLSHGTITGMDWPDDVTVVVHHDTWPYDTDITVTVLPGVKDLAGNEMGHPNSWMFTTGPPDTTPPTILSIAPADGSVIDPGTSQVVITFSEPIDPDSFQASEINAQMMAYLVDEEDNWSPDGTVLTVHLNAPLPAGLPLHAIIASFVDLAGNPNTSPTTWDVTVAGVADDFPVNDTLVYGFVRQETDQDNPVWDGKWRYEFNRFQWEDNQEDFRRLYMDDPDATATDWDYMSKLSDRLMFRGFREHDEESSTDNDYMFTPAVQYMALPISIGMFWSGVSYITTDDGTVTLNYNVQVPAGFTDVDIPGVVMEKRALAEEGDMRIFWSHCYSLYLYHDMIMDGDTLEVGIDTLRVAPAIGIVQTRSHGDDYTDDTWSWENSILFSIETIGD